MLRNGRTVKADEHQRMLNFTLDQFPSAMELLFELPTGESQGTMQKLRTASRSKNVFPSRKDIHSKMCEEFMWKLDQAASNVIESVKVSSVTESVKASNVKLHCDTWLSGLENKKSSSPKAAIIRSLRRALWFLLKKEIIQHSSCAPATYVYAVKEWKELFHEKSTDYLPQTYWALYLIEKAYYCVDPLSEMLIQLLTNEITTNSRTKLIAIGVDAVAIDNAILAFHAKLT